jgi:hypothetical protein
LLFVAVALVLILVALFAGLIGPIGSS